MEFEEQPLLTSTERESAMTVKQFRKKVDIARKYGEADLGSGLTLRYTGTYWSIMIGKQTIDTAEVVTRLEYLFK